MVYLLSNSKKHFLSFTEKSCLRTGDLKWYFFCPRLKKYPNGGKANRSTESGYWKTTGKDRDVTYNDEVVGKIRTLIFHYGKTPRGERTDWVIHEYRLEDRALVQRNIPQVMKILSRFYLLEINLVKYVVVCL